MTEKEIMEALLDGKKIGFHTWKEDQYLFLDVDGTLVDENCSQMKFSDIDIDYAFIYKEPEYFWVYKFDSKYIISPPMTERVALATYGSSLVQKVEDSNE